MSAGFNGVVFGVTVWLIFTFTEKEREKRAPAEETSRSV